MVTGKRMQNRMTYPPNGAEPRTDANFRQPNANNPAEFLHIKMRSILQKLPIDMVKLFIVADPLHLLELVNMKKYEQFYAVSL